MNTNLLEITKHKPKEKELTVWLLVTRVVASPFILIGYLAYFRGLLKNKNIYEKNLEAEIIRLKNTIASKRKWANKKVEEPVEFVLERWQKATKKGDQIEYSDLKVIKGGAEEVYEQICRKDI